LITWLFLGGLNGLLATTLPFHELERESLLEAISAILSAPATWLAIFVVALGFGLSWVRTKEFALFGSSWLKPLVDTAFGFETVNHVVVQGTSRFAERLRATQTGELNWNILGIIGALLAVLIFLWLGA